jgi:hypothetical protein
VLSDYEQRVLEDLERRCAAEAREPVASRRSGRRVNRPPGIRVMGALGCVIVVLLVVGPAVAALALATAAAIGWLFWRSWTHRADGGTGAASLLLGAGHGPSGSGIRPGESIRRYLRWLAEAE